MRSLPGILQRSAGALSRLGWITRALHLLALSTIAGAQPVFGELTGEYLISQNHEGLDVTLFAFGAVLLPPLAMLAAEFLAGLASKLAAAALHVVFVGAAAALIASHLVAEVFAPRSALQLAAALALGGGFAIAYALLAPMRSFAGYLALAAPVSLALFLLAPPASRLVLASGDAELERKRPAVPAVLIVFDELPASALMNRELEVDAARFPNFARLARGSTWFRNATGAHSFTERALPAILTGRRAQPDSLPLLADHPDNLFTLFGEPGALSASEPYTRLCPDELCPERASIPLGTRLVNLTRNMARLWLRLVLPEYFVSRFMIPAPERDVLYIRDRHAQFDRWVSRLGTRRSPRLDFLHVIHPHQPYVFLPSGRRYATDAPDRFARTSTDRFAQAPQLVRYWQQRYLLQVQDTDRMLGQAIDRLRRAGVWDRSLVMVASDHGVSFRPGDNNREATATNVHDILSTVLFVKRPGQREGRISDASVSTLDIVPTIAAETGVAVPWRAEGKSVFAPRPRPTTVSMAREGGAMVSLPLAEFERRRDASARDRLAAFGEGRDFYHLGPHADLIGKRVRALEPAQGPPGAATIALPERFADVRRTQFPPVVVSGSLRGAYARRGVMLAIALNGRVRGTAASDVLPGGGATFAASIPEHALQPGRNSVQVFAVERGSGRRRLTLLGSAP